MANARYVTGFALAAALALTAGCDRLEEAGKLAGEAFSQITGGAASEEPVLVLTDDQILAAASVDERALFGPMQAPIALTAINVDELLQTQRFYAVGSIIAKPRAEISEPVVDAGFNMATAPTNDASVMNTDDAPLPESAAAAAGAPLQEAPPPSADGATEASRATTQDGAPAILKPGIVRPRADIKLPPMAELRRQAQVAAPEALKEAVRDMGVELNVEALRKARQSAEETMKANSQTAQAIGDSISRKASAAIDPLPKPLQIRARLAVDQAIVARDKAGLTLERMGLSGIVTPGEGGQMRITIGVNPTQLRDGKLNLDRIASMRALFAPQKRSNAQECAGTPDIEKMKMDPVLATECVVKVLQQSGEYEYVEKDFIFTNQMLRKPTPKPAPAPIGSRPNDPLFGLQWHFRDNGTAAGQSAGGAGFGGFWDRSKDMGSRDIVVAVVDTGLQMNHPDIKGSPNLAAGYDMVSDPIMGNDGDGRDADPNDPGDKCNPDDATISDSFHGTHVAGTIGVAATNNGAGVAGGAWNVTIVPVRALGRCGGKLSDINDGIRWAAGTVPARTQGQEVWNSHPADIINLSIGLFGPCPASMQAAINDAVAAGAIVVSAAGNARVDTQYFAPGGCQNVISVAANDARGVLTPYSNFGANVAIMAPGGDMARDDDKDGRPDGILSTKFTKNCIDPANPGATVAQCYYAYENGTSMAAPHVSAALVLLKAKFPAAVPSELKTRLLQATSPRTNQQCSGACTAYPGSTPIPGSADMCYRPCGGRMLNLANAQLQ